MAYVDGFLLAVPTANKDKYRELAEIAAVVFKDHGALTCVECWGDDVPEGEVNSFHTAVMRKDDETVVFSWITWPSKEIRDKGLQAAMNDERMKCTETGMPFDGKRMMFGGFETLVDA